MTAKTAAVIFGLIFVAVGLLGFVENPIIGTSPDAIFHADTIHNGVHIASGVLFLLIAMAAPASAGTLLKVFGIVYLAVGIVGVVQLGKESGKVFGMLHVNANDNYLHIALGILIFLAGFIRSRRLVA